MRYWFLLLLLFLDACTQPKPPAQAQDACVHYPCVQGAIIRGDSLQPALALVMTGDAYAEGGAHIQRLLAEKDVKASFFFTGNFYRNPGFRPLIDSLRRDGHYLGAHSDRHLLYCSWEKRDSLLVTAEEFATDLAGNYREMERAGIAKSEAPFYLPPYEWYNDSISAWTRQWGLQLINYTPGTRSHADYTTEEMPNFVSSEAILASIREYEASYPAGLNGFILLMHIGAGPGRSDKFYLRLEELVDWLQGKGYRLVRIDELLAAANPGA